MTSLLRESAVEPTTVLSIGLFCDARVVHVDEELRREVRRVEDRLVLARFEPFSQVKSPNAKGSLGFSSTGGCGGGGAGLAAAGGVRASSAHGDDGVSGAPGGRRRRAGAPALPRVRAVRPAAEERARTARARSPERAATRRARRRNRADERASWDDLRSGGRAGAWQVPRATQRGGPQSLAATGSRRRKDGARRALRFRSGRNRRGILRPDAGSAGTRTECSTVTISQRLARAVSGRGGRSDEALRTGEHVSRSRSSSLPTCTTNPSLGSRRRCRAMTREA